MQNIFTYFVASTVFLCEAELQCSCGLKQKRND